MFNDREDGAMQLAAEIKGRALKNPLVLAIPRGGVVTGAVLARELNADLDIVLSRKLRAPLQPEFAVGAIGEDGQVYINRLGTEGLELSHDYLARERRHQQDEIARRKQLFRGSRPMAPVTDRSVLITDDGVATGSTMLAALQTIRAQQPFELIMAAPVVPADRLEELGNWCDEVICVLSPREFWAVGQFYRDFRQVEDEEVVEILKQFAATRHAAVRDKKTPYATLDK